MLTLLRLKNHVDITFVSKVCDLILMLLLGKISHYYGKLYYYFLYLCQENKSVDGLKKKIADLNQQISVNCKRRNKACKYITKILESSQSSNKGKTTLTV